MQWVNWLSLAQQRLMSPLSIHWLWRDIWRASAQHSATGASRSQITSFYCCSHWTKRSETIAGPTHVTLITGVCPLLIAQVSTGNPCGFMVKSKSSVLDRFPSLWTLEQLKPPQTGIVQQRDHRSQAVFSHSHCRCSSSQRENIYCHIYECVVSGWTRLRLKYLTRTWVQ